MLHSDLRLKSVDQYSLYIEDKFGCVDKDFPCLGRKEPIRKFQFEALVFGDRIDSVYSSDSDMDPDEIKLKVLDNGIVCFCKLKVKFIEKTNYFQNLINF